MIKIIITNNNEILYNSLSKIALKTKEKIEIINVRQNQLNSIIGQIKTRKNLIILDSLTPVVFYSNILKNAIKRKVNIIILVIDFNNLSSITTDEDQHRFFKKKLFNLSLLDTITLVSNALKESLEIEKNIDTILWRIGLPTYFKGTKYLKDAILLAYSNTELLFDSQSLVKKVAEKNQVLNDKLVRSDMDKALNNALDLLDINVLYDIFTDDYDGRKISLRYFIDLCIRYLENQKSS